MSADMPAYEILAGHCPPGEDCPKVARTPRRPGKVAIVGRRITNPAVLAALGVGEGEMAVEIDESLYREGGDNLDEGAVA
jgi:hypothetical protein